MSPQGRPKGESGRAKPDGMSMHPRRRRIAAALGWVAAAIALALVFAAYRRPDVAVDLANQLWNCF
jgi:hypothetical protein